MTCIPFKSTAMAVLCSAAALAAAPATASELSAGVVRVVGEKQDSGLGELPHYRHWADASGKGVGPVRVAGEKQDSGLGELPHYRHWATHKEGAERQPIKVSSSR